MDFGITCGKLLSRTDEHRKPVRPRQKHALTTCDLPSLPRHETGFLPAGITGAAATGGLPSLLSEESPAPCSAGAGSGFSLRKESRWRRRVN